MISLVRCRTVGVRSVTTGCGLVDRNQCAFLEGGRNIRQILCGRKP
jgi:hypothetical protein